MVESMEGPEEGIVDRSFENLAASDRMIAITRRRLIAAAQAHQKDGSIPPTVDRPELTRGARGGSFIALGQGRLARRLCRGAAQGAEPDGLPAASRRVAAETRETPRKASPPQGNALLRESAPAAAIRVQDEDKEDTSCRTRTSVRRAVPSSRARWRLAPRRSSAAPRRSRPHGVSPQLAELYEKAKPEGEVTIWAPGAPSVQWIPAEFAKRFPAVKVNWLGDQQASSRLIAEKRAGRHAVDVWTFSLGGTLEVQKRGLLEKFDWRQYGAQDRDIFWDGEAVANHNYVYAPIFAKAKLTKEQVPRRWDELLDAQWTDKLVSDSFLLPRLGGYLAIDWGLERTETLDQDADRAAQAPGHHLAGVELPQVGRTPARRRRERERRLPDEQGRAQCRLPDHGDGAGDAVRAGRQSSRRRIPTPPGC